MLVAGHSWASGWSREWSVPTKAALFQARKRLGSAPLRALFDKAVVPFTDPQVAGGFYRSWRLMSMDGLCLDVADTEANVERFGRPASSRGDGRGGAFPQVRVLGLAECGSHTIIDAAVGSYRHGEQSLAEQVLRSLLPACCCWPIAGSSATRCGTRPVAPAQTCCGGSSPTLCCPSKSVTATDLSHPTSIRDQSTPQQDQRHRGPSRRVHARARRDLPYAPARTYRLMTTITDPNAAPASELARIYTQRWEIETAFAELKTHQRSPGLVLRSKMPDGVIQEVYGYLCVHYAIRWLMHSAATDYGHDPDRLSFTRSLRAARRTTASHPGFSP